MMRMNGTSTKTNYESRTVEKRKNDYYQNVTDMKETISGSSVVHHPIQQIL